MEPIAIVPQYAPEQRLPLEIVRRQAEALKRDPVLVGLLDSMAIPILVLNAQHQITLANKSAQTLIPNRPLDQVIGLRPGEAFGCIHAEETPSGCGTSAYCTECGSLHAIWDCIRQEAGARECRMMRMVNGQMEALDLLVHAAPLTVNGDTYALVSLMDISHAKRRLVLERIFFHDVINVAGGVSGLLEQIASSAPEGLRSDLELARRSLQDMLEQIHLQRDLLAAEAHELRPAISRFDMVKLVRQVVDLYQHHPSAEGRRIVLLEAPSECMVQTDPVLLRRVLGNLVKNAIEATARGGVVSLRVADKGNCAICSVHNDSVMPRQVQLQVFNRNFTTKGSGRGLGTYSAKLLTEHYLSGRLYFNSVPGKGTEFVVEIPHDKSNSANVSQQGSPQNTP